GVVTKLGFASTNPRGVVTKLGFASTNPRGVVTKLSLREHESARSYLGGLTREYEDLTTPSIDGVEWTRHTRQRGQRTSRGNHWTSQPRRDCRCSRFLPRRRRSTAGPVAHLRTLNDRQLRRLDCRRPMIARRHLRCPRWSRC